MIGPPQMAGLERMSVGDNIGPGVRFGMLLCYVSAVINERVNIDSETGTECHP